MSLPPAAIAAHPVLFSGRGQEGIIIHKTLFFRFLSGSISDSIKDREEKGKKEKREEKKRRKNPNQL